jgi:hypothetical protein
MLLVSGATSSVLSFLWAHCVAPKAVAAISPITPMIWSRFTLHGLECRDYTLRKPENAL